MIDELIAGLITPDAARFLHDAPGWSESWLGRRPGLVEAWAEPERNAVQLAGASGRPVAPRSGRFGGPESFGRALSCLH